MRISVPVTAEVLTQEVRAFRRLVEKRTTREYLPHAQQLYDWLIRPLESELVHLKIETLVLVPDGVLRTIPISALHDGKARITSYNVCYTKLLRAGNVDAESFARRLESIQVTALQPRSETLEYAWFANSAYP